MHNPLDMIVFAKVVELKSFSAAAQRLEMSRSVISKHVTRLERSLGVRLLNRTTRRLALTDAGHAVFEHCVRVSMEAEASELAASAFAKRPQGLLRLSAPGAFGRLHLVPALQPFLATYPEIALEMVMGDRHVDLVTERFDVAITSEPMGRNNLVVSPLAPIRWIVCASPEYLRRHGAPAEPAGLEAHNCIFYSSPITPGNVWNFRREGLHTAVNVKGNFRVNNSEAVREAALRGTGIALLPTFAVAHDLAAGTLRVLLPQCEPVGIFGPHLLVHHLAGRLVPPKVRVLVEFLLEHFRGEPAWDRVVAESTRRWGTA